MEIKVSGKILTGAALLGLVKVGDILYWEKCDNNDNDYKTDIISLCFKIEDPSFRVQNTYYFKECYANGELISSQKDDDYIETFQKTSSKNGWNMWKVYLIRNKKIKSKLMRIILSSRI